MHKTFLKYEKPLLTVMVKNVIPDKAVKEMKTALENGAEAFGIQAENFPREYHTKADFRNIFAAAEDKPIYIPIIDWLTILSWLTMNWLKNLSVLQSLGRHYAMFRAICSANTLMN